MFTPNYDYYSAQTTNSPTLDWWDYSPQMRYYKPQVSGLVEMSGTHRMGMLNNNPDLGSVYYNPMGFMDMSAPSPALMISGLGALVALSSLLVKGKNKKAKKMKKMMLAGGAVVSLGALGYNQFVA